MQRKLEWECIEKRANICAGLLHLYLYIVHDSQRRCTQYLEDNSCCGRRLALPRCFKTGSLCSTLPLRLDVLIPDFLANLITLHCGVLSPCRFRISFLPMLMVTFGFPSLNFGARFSTFTFSLLSLPRFRRGDAATSVDVVHGVLYSIAQSENDGSTANACFIMHRYTYVPYWCTLCEKFIITAVICYAAAVVEREGGERTTAVHRPHFEGRTRSGTADYTEGPTLKGCEPVWPDIWRLVAEASDLFPIT